MTITPEFLWQLGLALAGGLVTYGGIRSDLGSMQERIRANENSVAEAHKRLDNHIDKA